MTALDKIRPILETLVGFDTVSATDIAKARREIAARAISMANEGAFALPGATQAAA